jgi:hypothetical protein
MATHKSLMERTPTLKQYINHKVHVLKEIGMTDSNAIRDYFYSKISDISTDEKKELKIDRLARDMIDSYFDGDHTFIRA